MEIDTSIYRSPKRKRGHPAPGPRVTTSGLSQSQIYTDDQSEEISSHSPSARVAGKFQKLDLQSPIDLPSPVDSQGEPPFHEVQITARSTNISPPQEFRPLEAANFTFESPVMKPATLRTTSTSSPEIFTPTPMLTPPNSSSTRAGSPPPSDVHSNQFWQASEITGWTPGDPDEDFYGLNGVGYAKPAGKAWAISQKRKQQIADYRSRETRDARAKRHERRKAATGSRKGSPGLASRPDSRNGSGSGDGDGDGMRDERTGSVEKSVRFARAEDD